MICTGARELQVQAVAGGGVHALRVLHHDAHRPEHYSPHAQGSSQPMTIYL